MNCTKSTPTVPHTTETSLLTTNASDTTKFPDTTRAPYTSWAPTTTVAPVPTTVSPSTSEVSVTTTDHHTSDAAVTTQMTTGNPKTGNVVTCYYSNWAYWRTGRFKVLTPIKKININK